MTPVNNTGSADWPRVSPAVVFGCAQQMLTLGRKGSAIQCQPQTKPTHGSDCRSTRATPRWPGKKPHLRGKARLVNTPPPRPSGTLRGRRGHPAPGAREPGRGTTRQARQHRESAIGPRVKDGTQDKNPDAEDNPFGPGRGSSPFTGRPGNFSPTRDRGPPVRPASRCERTSSRGAVSIPTLQPVHRFSKDRSVPSTNAPNPIATGG